jgi:hypothetical protein
VRAGNCSAGTLRRPGRRDLPSLDPTSSGAVVELIARRLAVRIRPCASPRAGDRPAIAYRVASVVCATDTACPTGWPDPGGRAVARGICRRSAILRADTLQSRAWKPSWAEMAAAASTTALA